MASFRQNKQKFLTLVDVNFNGKIHRMVRYNCENDGPRPESYFEDYELVQMHTSNENEKEQMYWELKTGAETGWDYSSRYISKKKQSKFIRNSGRKYYKII